MGLRYTVFVQVLRMMMFHVRPFVGHSMFNVQLRILPQLIMHCDLQARANIAPPSVLHNIIARRREHAHTLPEARRHRPQARAA